MLCEGTERLAIENWLGMIKDSAETTLEYSGDEWKLSLADYYRLLFGNYTYDRDGS